MHEFKVQQAPYTLGNIFKDMFDELLPIIEQAKKIRKPIIGIDDKIHLKGSGVNSYDDEEIE
ncbi:MAG: hypothetical protein ACP5PS_07635 [Bacteroidales bacterium]